MTDEQKKILREEIIKSPSEIYWNEPMKKHTTFKNGGVAEVLIKIKDLETLIHTCKFAKKENLPITILGNGSNILVLDKGIKGITIILQMTKFKIDNNIITVDAGSKMMGIANSIMNKGLTGFEELSGIPGTVGGAVYMNAGAHGKEMKDVVTSITYLDENLEIKKMKNEDADFKYRHSIFSNKDYVILEVTIKLEKGNKEEIKEKMNQYAQYRKENQPIEFPNAGSTFKRGDGFITAKLIDDCGLKGYSIGGAQVSTKHAGFIINKGEATAQDVLSLVEYVQGKVYKKYQKKIELEMKIIGE